MKIKKIIKNTIGNLESSDSIANFFGDSHFVNNPFNNEKPNVLHSLFPYRFYNTKNKIYHNQIQVDGDSKGKFTEETCGFILKATPIIGCSESEIDILANFFNDNLPEGLILQIINYASPRVGEFFDGWKKKRYEEGGVYKDLADKRIEFLNSGRWKSLFTSPFVIRDFSIYISASLSKNKYKNAEDILNTLRDNFVNNLRNVSIYTENVSPDSLLSLLDEIITPNPEKTHKSKVKWDPLNPINVQSSNSEAEIEVKGDGVHLSNNIVAKSYSTSAYPQIWGGWEMINLLGSEHRDELRLTCPFITSLTIHAPNASKSKSKAIVRNQVLEPRSKSNIARFWQDVDQMSRDWKYVVDHLDKGHKFVSAKYSVLLLCPKETIDSAEEKLKAIYTSKGWEIRRDNLFQLPSLLSFLPFFINSKRFNDFKQLGKVRSMLSWTCSNISPFQGEYKGALAQPYVLMLGKRGQPLFWNPYYAPEAGGNYNVVVTGKSGSGKSVFIQDLASSIRGSGGRLFVIDNGESFQNSSVLQGGKFIKINQDISVNPFLMFDQNAMVNKAEYRTDVLNFFTSFLSQICRPISKINEDEKSLLTIACENIIEKHAHKGSLELISQELLKIPQDKKQEQICTSLKLSLDVFLKKYGNYFKGNSDLEINNKFLVFEMANLEGGGMEDLKAVIMMLMMHLITEIIYKGDRVTRSALIIDEAWTMLKGGSMEEFIEGFVRRVRKFGGSLITASQSINDYYTNPAAKAVLDNSQWKVFLAQNRDAIDYLKEHKIININKALEESLKNLRMVGGCYSECLVYGDSGWYVGRLVLDPFSIFLYSSKAEEVAAINTLKAQGFSVEAAIQQLIKNDND